MWLFWINENNSFYSYLLKLSSRRMNKCWIKANGTGIFIISQLIPKNIAGTHLKIWNYYKLAAKTSHLMSSYQKHRNFSAFIFPYKCWLFQYLDASLVPIHSKKCRKGRGMKKTAVFSMIRSPQWKRWISTLISIQQIYVSLKHLLPWWSHPSMSQRQRTTPETG